ncbi:hypothetical protein EXU57_06100 [Segetibacter sp. 3557_3]|uniref:hypothetical protein n=1 Tax=Segetibacter sp. 3557_3 TaxID=2547429 RepID=UPI0010583F07|nr:hypothetical protein [Segetibacter sp. 3557_3]TDH28033.1 hypothetical protein EXU57_06100 [Segetibacter sp. 3557_3]
MKKILLLTSVLLATAMYKSANAQVSIRVNIGDQPVWGPVGYDFVDYYYFPEADFYYNVPQQQFIYFDGRRWVSAYALPGRYSNYDLFRSYKVVVNDPDPFRRNDYYRSRYGNFRGQSQTIIYDSRDPRYYIIEKHPEHSRWLASRRSNEYGRNYRNDEFNNPRRYDNRDYNRSFNDRNNNRSFDSREFNNNDVKRFNPIPRGNESFRDNRRGPDLRETGNPGREGRPYRRF